MNPFRAAVVQAGSVLFDTQRSLDKLADLTADAARRGAKLVVFPEAFIGGYPKGLDFGARLGMRSAEGRDDFRRYFDGAIAADGPEAARIAEAARANAVTLVAGVIERCGGTLYCTTLTYDANGEYLGKHRKLMPTALERLVWGFGDGSTLPVFDTPLGKLGSVICWENYMPLLRTAMYAKGIELYCAPTVDDRESWLPTMRMIAMEGRCFVLSACQYLMLGDYPEPYAHHLGGKNEAVIRGGSCIIGPLGDVLVPPSFDGERIAVAEIDPGQIARGKYDLDVVGHYARPDIFQLIVDERKKDPVIRKS
jgi:nitrilase